jgi:hypothetical protein
MFPRQAVAVTVPIHYTGAMERLEIIDTLKDLPDTLERELAGLSDAVIGFKPAENEWSVREVMGHLSFAEDIWFKRLYQVWSLTDPMLVTFAGEDEALEAARQATSIAPYLEHIRNNRPKTIELLAHAVDWTRLGQWRGVGRRSLKQLAEALVKHDADHIRQLQALKAAQATPIR